MAGRKYVKKSVAQKKKGMMGNQGYLCMTGKIRMSRRTLSPSAAKH
jgi:hypothetical protein